MRAMENTCTFQSSAEINFLIPSENFSQVKRWLQFCKAVYVQNCDIQMLKPQLTNIPTMMALSTYDDCFSTRQLASYCVSIALSVAIILSNTTIIAAFARYRNLLTTSNLPILSLALSDLLTGITFIYSAAWNLSILVAGYQFDLDLIQSLVLKRTNYYMCLTLDGPGLLFTCMMSSVFSLGAVAVERYIGVMHPYQYPRLISVPKLVAVIAILWIIAVVVGALPVMGWNNWTGKCQLVSVIDFSYLILWSVICFLCGLVMLYIYLRIFILARKHGRQIVATQITSTSTISLRTSTQETLSSTNRQVANRVKWPDKNEKQTTKPKSLKNNAEASNINKTNVVEPATASGIEDHSKIESPSSTNENSVKADIADLSVGQKYRSPEGGETAGDINTDETLPNRLPSMTGSKRSKVRRPSRKAIVTTALILGAFYVSWTPFLVYLLAYHQQYNNLTVYYLAVVTQLNSIFNPILYGIRNTEIRKAIVKLFRCA